MKRYAFGVDIGGTSVKLGLFGSNGKLLESWEIVTRLQDKGKYILSDIAESVQDKCKERGISKKEAAGIGLGVPGPLQEDGTVLRCVNLGWDICNAAQELQKQTGLPVRSGNDANVAALGELWQGGGRGYRNMVMITLGTGVGGGIILAGKILSGEHGAAGEIGHLHVCDDETEQCGCGRRGCLEQYASANGLVRLARQYIAQDIGHSTVLCLEQDFTAKDVFDAAKAGDPLALQLVEKVGDYLGRSLAQIACVADPEAFVIGGGMAKAGEILLQSVQKYFRRYAFHACEKIEFKLAELGNTAGIYGSAKMILDI